MKKLVLIFTGIMVAVGTACGPAANNLSNANHANHNANSNTNAAPGGPQNLTEVERPQKVKDMMAARGEQDSAKPILMILAPKDGSDVTGSIVKVRLGLASNLKDYQPGMDEETHTGNHIHVILDNQPYEAYYNLNQEFELRNVSDGEHTLRVFASRPWHESYKNDGSFQMVKFTVKGGNANANQPATTNSGQQMSNAKSSFNAPAPPSNSNANAAPTPEGKAMQASTGGAVDAKKPLLTYSRPKGEYKDADADAIMIDFWLANGKLVGDGGEYRVRYSVNGGEPKFIEKWAPIWLQGWTAGKHSIKLELVDKDGKVVDNGGYNSTTRDITVVK
ncbi:MAG TPA: hypothetical protein PLK77_07080 [Pyrinomonadaceae bacterium]|nr:hypothetical protein [Pyrinomonadaceae bacterium]